MTPKQFARNIEARIDALNANREAEALQIAFDLVGQIRLRIRAEGQNFREQPFEPYTPGYAKQRAKAGYQVGYVDFTRTGQMLNSVRPETINRTEESVTVEVASRTAQDRVKLRGQRRKRGNILLPSEQEIQTAAQANIKRILKYMEL